MSFRNSVLIAAGCAALFARAAWTASAAIQITPDPLVFPDTRVGASAAPQALTLKNASSATVKITSVGLSDARNFSLSSDGCTGKQLKKNESCAVAASFQPGKAGYYASSLVVIHSGSGGVDHGELEGRGVQTGVALSASSIAFGNQTVGAASEERIVALVNSGSMALSISGISASADFGVAQDCGASVAPLAGCTLRVTFLPPAVGAFTGLVTITDDDPTSPQTIALGGTGIEPGQPDAGLSRTEIDFGAQPVGTAGGPELVTLTNTGTVDLAIGGIVASLPFDAADDCPATLSPASSCSISITFTPPEEALYGGAALVASDALDSPGIILLSGEGMESGGAQASLSADELDFGTVLVGEVSEAKALTVTNAGESDLSIAAVEIEETDYSFSERDDCRGRTLSFGGSCTIEVDFAPAFGVPSLAIMSIFDDAPDSPQLAALSGTGATQIGGGGGGCRLAPGGGGMPRLVLSFLLALFLAGLVTRPALRNASRARSRRGGPSC